MHRCRRIYIREDGSLLPSLSNLYFHRDRDRARQNVFWTLSLHVGAKEIERSLCAKSLPTVVCGFNHAIKVEDSGVIKPDFLWKFITRGAMIICKESQEGIDLVLRPRPSMSVSLDEKLSRDSVTAITILVKNSATYGLQCNEKLFDAMDPSRLGVLSDFPQPIIRMVFALASPEGGISLPAQHECEPRNADPFTSYDIWCADLSSTETFKQIGKDEDSYRTLLDPSQRSHDAFAETELEDFLSEETKTIVGKARRGMAPLIKSSGHDEIHHRPNQRKRT